MRKIHYILYMTFAALFFTACQEEDFGSGAKGGIRISLTEEVGVDVTTRSTPEELGKPVAANFKFKITDNTGATENYDYTDKVIPLSAGKYEVVAFCGSLATTVALDAPYYEGFAEATVEEGKTTNVTLSCKVANALLSIQINEDDKEKFEAAFKTPSFQLTVGGKSVATSDITKSFYFPAGSTISKLAFSKDGSDYQDLEIKNWPQEIKAADHIIVTVGMEPAPSGVSLTVEKMKVETVTIPETIPMEWLPKPKVEAEGFDGNALTFAETETKAAKLNLDLASALQDMRLKFTFGDNQFASLNRDTGYLWSNEEDKKVISEQLGISISDKSVDLNGLLAKLQTNAGESTTNTIEVDVKANDRWSSEDEEANRIYTITCNKPVFRVDAYPGNIWTKEFTMNALREEQVESGDFAKISGNIKYQYSTDGENNWTDLGDGFRQANLTPGTTYYIRGLYRDAVPSEVTEVMTYEAMDIPNSTFDDGYDATYPKDDNPLYIFKGGWIDTRNELTCHSNGANTFYVSKSSTLPVNDNESTVAHMMVIGWGAGNSCAFGFKTGSVINNISSGLVCVGDYDVNSDVINPKEAYIRPSSLTFTYKASPYNGDEYLIEATLLNITDGIETIIGEGKLQSGVSVNSYTTQSLDITYDESVKELPISHVKVLFKAGTKENRDHLEDKFRDASFPYSSAYLIGSQFWLDSFQFNYDK